VSFEKLAPFQIAISLVIHNFGFWRTCDVKPEVLVYPQWNVPLWREGERKKKSGNVIPVNRPWKPIGLWDVENPTFCRHSAHRWRWDNLTRRSSFTSRKIPDRSAAGRIEKSNDLIGNGILDSVPKGKEKEMEIPLNTSWNETSFYDLSFNINWT
jgi:hypothetical protein